MQLQAMGEAGVVQLYPNKEGKLVNANGERVDYLGRACKSAALRAAPAASGALMKHGRKTCMQAVQLQVASAGVCTHGQSGADTGRGYIFSGRCGQP